MTVIQKPEKFPRVVCLIGSTRFADSWERAGYEETLIGHVTLALGSTTWGDKKQEEYHKKRFDELHLRKIDLADEVLVINEGNYIGESTRAEIEYAFQTQKPVRYMYPTG